MILDTNALSYYADGVPAVVALVDASASVEIPVIVLGEFRYGIAHSKKRRQYEPWLEEFLQDCGVLDITQETASEYAAIASELRIAATPIPANDHWIAALARQYHLQVMSRDRHFDRVKGIRRVDW